MRRASGLIAVICACMIAAVPAVCTAIDYGPGPCIPDRPIPPETLGSVSMPFDVPIWPTLLKTEFQILPWVSFSRASVCLPGTGRSIDIPAPCFSLKAIPIWIPWLRPLDIECKPNTAACPPPCR